MPTGKNIGPMKWNLVLKNIKTPLQQFPDNNYKLTHSQSTMYKLYLLCTIGFALFNLAAVAQTDIPDKIKKPQTYELKSGKAIMKISANGGRIVSFSLDDHECLTTASQHQNFGSTLWTAPQSDWGWPPYAVLDQDEYLVEQMGDKLKMKSNPDPKSGFQIEKSWQPIGDQSIRIEYTIRNISESEKAVGPWEVTRVPCGGIAFFPDGDNAKIPESSLKPDMHKKGINWISINKTPIPEHQKLFSTASDGWLAYELNGILFIKQFPDIKPEHYSPQQAEVEIYTRNDKSYSELENHGAYRVLQPGESTSYSVIWSLVPLPKKVKINEGSRKLASFTRKQISQDNTSKLLVNQ